MNEAPIVFCGAVGLAGILASLLGLWYLFAEMRRLSKRMTELEDRLHLLETHTDYNDAIINELRRRISK